MYLYIYHDLVYSNFLKLVRNYNNKGYRAQRCVPTEYNPQLCIFEIVNE